MRRDAAVISSACLGERISAADYSVLGTWNVLQVDCATQRFSELGLIFVADVAEAVDERHKEAAIQKRTRQPVVATQSGKNET